MWARQNHARKWSIRRIAIVACLATFATYAAFSLWKTESRLYEVGVECSKLDPEAIKLTVATLYVSGLPDRKISRENPDGTRSTYPLYPLSPKEYLAKYPNCCRYYPDEYSYEKLPRRWRLEGICGSVDVLKPHDYIKDGQIMKGSDGGSTLLVDMNMNLSRAKH